MKWDLERLRRDRLQHEALLNWWLLVAIVALVVLFAMAAFGQSPPPAVSEVEQLKFENLQLKANQIQSQMKDLQAQFIDIQKQYKDLTEQVEREHPGYAWNGSALTAKPAPPKEAPPKTMSK